MFGDESFGGDTVAAVFAVVVAIVTLVVVGCVAVWEFSCAVSFVSPAAVVTALGVGAVRVAVLALGTMYEAVSFAGGSVLAIRVSVFNTAFMAAMFAFKLNAKFSHCFFFWECFPCPGPGIAEYKN